MTPALQALTLYRQFILYKLVPSTRAGKTDKLPVNPTTLEVANAHDKSIWKTYDEVQAIRATLDTTYGMGFVFTDNDPFFFLDIDNCINERGEWNEIASYLLHTFRDAAIEISVSNKGCHIIGICSGISHACKNAEWGIEFYTTQRFCALTDNTIGDGNAVTDCTSILPPVIDRYFPPTAEVTPEEWRNEPVPESNPIESDDDLIIKACKSKSAASTFSGKASFNDLWTNNELVLATSYPVLNDVDPYDRSSADAALAQQLAFWTGKNHARIQRIMGLSGLVRDKWVKHKKYLHMTISRAVSKQVDVYSAKTSSDINSSEKKDEYEGIFILPGNNYPIIDSAEHIFSEIAKHRNIFIYGGTPVELKISNGRYILVPVIAEGFRSRIESYGKKTMSYVAHNDHIALKLKLCSNEDSKALLATKQIIEHLPNIRALLDCSVLSKELRTLGKGYHEDNGGLLITKGKEPPDICITQAVPALLKLLQDFVFSTDSDYSRAVSMMITPALKMGGFILSPCPADISEADESQSGKTYRHKLNAAIYNDAPIIVALKKGGVGSVDESIATALATGRPFILLDNFRGNFDSTFLEAAITTPETVPVRLPNRAEQIIDAQSVTFQLSSNGVNTTKDMANRSCMVRIRKKHNKKWYVWTEGKLIAHVQKHQAYYLGCIFSVIKEWGKLGYHKTDTTDHDMIEWAQSVDWIIQNIFKLDPLLDGHKAVQQEISNPDLVWLRAVCIAVENTERLGVEFQAHDIAELCEETGITWPGGRVHTDSQAEQKYVGTIMRRIFKNELDDRTTIDNFIVHRVIKPIYNKTRQGFLDKKIYTIIMK